MKEFRQSKKENFREQWLGMENELRHILFRLHSLQKIIRRRSKQSRKNSMVKNSKKRRSASKHEDEDEPETSETCDDSATDVVSS
jgi:hypothetical protein